MKLALRVLAMIVGLIGSVVALIVDLITFVVRHLDKVQSHTFVGFLLTILAFVGALLAVPSGLIGAVLLAVAGIALFYPLGLGAIWAAIFLLPAAVLAYMDRRRATAS